MRVGRALAAGDVLCEVLVALEPVVEVTRDDVRRVREVAGHQRVYGRERGLDRLALQRIVSAAAGPLTGVPACGFDRQL